MDDANFYSVSRTECGSPEQQPTPGFSENGDLTPSKASSSSSVSSPILRLQSTPCSSFSPGIVFDYSAHVTKVFNVPSTCDIVWAHAVNSVVKLQLALASRCHMLEVDVRRGTLDKSASAMTQCASTRIKTKSALVCCHPPFTVSDLSLEDLLEHVCKHNDQCAESEGSSTPKGVKIDLKTRSGAAEVVAMCMKYDVCDRTPTLWLNADVLLGPGVMNVHTIPVSPFLHACSQLPYAVVSLSWKCTEYSVRCAAYSSKMVDEMIHFVHSHIIPNVHVTFAVCAAYAVASMPEFERLLAECKKQHVSASLTVWTGTGSMGITQEVRDNILVEARNRSVDIFLDVVMRKAGRSCNDACVIS